MAKSKTYITLSAAITLDGKIASKKGDSKLSSKSDKIRLYKFRKNFDAILVGKNTILVDNPVLSTHNYGKNPTRIILDSNAKIPLGSKIIQSSRKIPTILAVSESAPKTKLESLKKLCVDVIVCGKNTVNLKKLLSILAKRQIYSILLEGGGTVNWSFLKFGLIDEAVITITPFLAGGKNSPSLIDGDGFSSITKSQKLKLYKVKKMQNEILLHYKI